MKEPTRERDEQMLAALQMREAGITWASIAEQLGVEVNNIKGPTLRLIREVKAAPD